MTVHCVVTIRKAQPLAGRLTWHGLNISVEYNPGSYKTGVAPDGTPWATLMQYPYGYIRMTEGMDGEHVDCFVGHSYDAPNVYCITCRRPPDFRQNDEDKCMLGFSSQEAARDAFLAHYDDPRFLGKITPMPLDEFIRKVLATREHPKLLRSRR